MANLFCWALRTPEPFSSFKPCDGILSCYHPYSCMQFPTRCFTVPKSENLPIDEFHVAQKRQSTDFEDMILLNVRSIGLFLGTIRL